MMRFTRILLLLYCFSILLSGTSQAFTDPEEMESFMRQTEKRMNLQNTINRIEKSEIDAHKLQIIYAILQNTPEIYIHNLNSVTGNTENDTTSQQERIFGFVCDVEMGLRKTLESKGRIDDLKDGNWDKLGQIQALAIFVLALRKADSDSLYSLFEKDASEITEDDITNSLRALEYGLNKVYGD